MNASAKAVEAIEAVDNKKIIKPTSKALVTQDLSVFTNEDLEFFSYVENELAVLTKQFKDRSLPEGDDAYAEIHETAMMFVKSRTGLDKNRKLLNTTDNQRVKVRNAFSNEIEAKLKLLEKPWADAKKKADEAKANAEAEAAAAELVRIDKIEKRIVNIRNLSTTITSLESGEKCLSQLDTLEGDLSWAEEFSENAIKFITMSRTDVQARVDHHKELIAKEAKIAEQQAEMDRQAEEMKKQQDALAAQQAKLDQQQAEIDRQAQEKADAEAAEKNRKTQEQADAEAVEQAKIETAKVAALPSSTKGSDAVQRKKPTVQKSEHIEPIVECETTQTALAEDFLETASGEKDEDRVTFGAWLEELQDHARKIPSFNEERYTSMAKMISNEIDETVDAALTSTLMEKI